MKLSFKNVEFDFSKRTYIMGILNVTPDSFSDGGRYFHKKDALARGLRLEEEGADIIDIGGESTRPGAMRVSAKEEIKRVTPVVEELAKHVKVPISVDTYKAEVADASVKAGASMINDISGLRFDPAMAGVASEHDVPVAIMHIKGTPRNMQRNPFYRSLMSEITEYLREGIIRAKKAGLAEERIVIDPGIGFGKTVEHNLEIIRRLSAFEGLEKPILLGHSRKSFIGRVLDDVPAGDRLDGTAAVTAIGIMNGANIIRVHDVREMVRVARIADAIKRA